MIDGNEFIQLAGKLCVLSGADEANFRTAAGRAYYGAIHLTRRFLDDLGIPVPRNENIHAFLQNQLLNSGHPMATSAGSLLRNLHQDRIRSDYVAIDRRFETPELAQRSVENAHHLRTAFSECRQEPARSEIRAGILEYRSKLGD